MANSVRTTGKGAYLSIDYTELWAATKRLEEAWDVRKKDLNTIYRQSTQPLVRQAKRNVRKRTSGDLKSRYSARMHVPGSLRSRIMFKVSRRLRLTWFVGPMSRTASKMNTYYAYMYAGGHKDKVVGGYQKAHGEKPRPAFIRGRWMAAGTKLRGYAGIPFMENAFNATNSVVISRLNDLIGKFIKKNWEK